MSNYWHRYLACLWLVIILCLAAYSTYSLLVQDKIQFDILALLPAGKTEKMEAVSEFMQDAHLSNRVVILLGHKDAATAKSALTHLRDEITAKALPMQEQNASAIAQDYKKLFTNLYPYRAGLLSKTDTLLLKQGHEEILATRALAEAVSPFGTFRSGQIDSDPFSLYSQFVTSLYSSLAVERDTAGDLFVRSNGITWYLFQGMITDSAFSLKTQKELTNQLSTILSSSPIKQVSILKTGALFYAAAGAQQAHHEISKIGLISIIGIIFLILFVFRTMRPLLLAVTVVLSGLVGGLASCLYFFGSIHILALVFGCSLIGVAVDYALYFFCASYLPSKSNRPLSKLAAVREVKEGSEHRTAAYIDVREDSSTEPTNKFPTAVEFGKRSNNAFAVLSLLIPALPLAVLASCMGYGLLMAVPFPGIQQMAVFACAGLLCTFISVCLWGVYFVRPSLQDHFLDPSLRAYFAKQSRRNIKQSFTSHVDGIKPQSEEDLMRLQSIQGYIEKLAWVGQKKYCRPILAIILLSIFCVGMKNLTFEDNVRHFQSMDPDLMAQETQIKSMMKMDMSSKFLAIKADSLEKVLQTEEQITRDLDGLNISYRAIADLLPSQKRQQENRNALENQLYKKYYQKFMQSLGFKKNSNAEALGFNQALLLSSQTDIKNLPTGWRELIHYSHQGLITGRIILNGITDNALVEQIVSKNPGVYLIDPAKEYSDLFSSYRKIMMLLVSGVLLGFTIFLLLQKGMKVAITIIFPVVLSILASIGIIGFFETFSLFNAMGLMLVLCIGIDYALFLYWRGAKEGKDLRLLGNALAATATILSFGLLALSKTAAVHSFGLSVFLGIVLCFFITTFFLGKHAYSNSKN